MDNNDSDATACSNKISADDTYEDDEVFFGPITNRELLKAKSFRNRKTEQLSLHQSMDKCLTSGDTSNLCTSTEPLMMLTKTSTFLTLEECASQPNMTDESIRNNFVEKISGDSNSGFNQLNRDNASKNTEVTCHNIYTSEVTHCQTEDTKESFNKSSDTVSMINSDERNCSSFDHQSTFSEELNQSYQSGSSEFSGHMDSSVSDVLSENLSKNEKKTNSEIAKSCGGDEVEMSEPNKELMKSTFIYGSEESNSSEERNCVSSIRSVSEKDSEIGGSDKSVCTKSSQSDLIAEYGSESSNEISDRIGTSINVGDYSKENSDVVRQSECEFILPVSDFCKRIHQSDSVGLKRESYFSSLEVINIENDKIFESFITEDNFSLPHELQKCDSKVCNTELTQPSDSLDSNSSAIASVGVCCGSSQEFDSGDGTPNYGMILSSNSQSSESLSVHEELHQKVGKDKIMNAVVSCANDSLDVISKTQISSAANSEYSDNDDNESVAQLPKLSSSKHFNDTIEEIEFLLKYGGRYYQEGQSDTTDNQQIFTDSSNNECGGTHKGSPKEINRDNSAVSSLQGSTVIPSNNTGTAAQQSQETLSNVVNINESTAEFKQEISRCPEGSDDYILKHQHKYVHNSVVKDEAIMKQEIKKKPDILEETILSPKKMSVASAVSSTSFSPNYNSSRNSTDLMQSHSLGIKNNDGGTFILTVKKTLFGKSNEADGMQQKRIPPPKPPRNTKPSPAKSITNNPGYTPLEDSKYSVDTPEIQVRRMQLRRSVIFSSKRSYVTPVRSKTQVEADMIISSISDSKTSKSTGKLNYLQNPNTIVYKPTSLTSTPVSTGRGNRPATPARVPNIRSSVTHASISKLKPQPSLSRTVNFKKAVSPVFQRPFFTPQGRCGDHRLNKYSSLKRELSDPKLTPQGCKQRVRNLNIVSPVAKYLQDNPPPPLIATIKPKYRISPQKFQYSPSAAAFLRPVEEPAKTTTLDLDMSTLQREKSLQRINNDMKKLTLKVNNKESHVDEAKERRKSISKIPRTVLPTSVYLPGRALHLENKENVMRQREIPSDNLPSSILRHKGRIQVPKQKVLRPLDNESSLYSMPLVVQDHCEAKSINDSRVSLMDVSVYEKASVHHTNTLK